MAIRMAGTNEGRTYPIKLTLTDPLTGNGVTLSSGTWTLRDHNGEVVGANDRALTGLVSPIVFAVPGDDLVLPASLNVPVDYTVTLEGRYNHATYGNNQRWTEELSFEVRPLAGIRPS
jgi:hypothetical protein